MQASLLLLLGAVPLILLLSRRVGRNLVALAKDAGLIRNFDFSGELPKGSFIAEVDVMIRAFGMMKETVRERTHTLEVARAKLEKLLEIGIALSSSHDDKSLLSTIIDGGKMLLGAQASTLFLRTEDDRLVFALRSMEDELPFQSLSMYLENGEPNHHFVSTHVALTGETVVIDDVRRDERFDLSGTLEFDMRTGFFTRSMIALPLLTTRGRVMGVLQVLNAGGGAEGVTFNEEDCNFARALASQAAVAMENQQLLVTQRELFQAIVHMVAGAIDAKSPYTRGHCERVPILAGLMAQAAVESDRAEFAGFSLDEEEAEAFQIASWLHDCGKVTTPEHVVDKATKLETIYNRIHEIRTRFEVLYRDAHIRFLQEVLAGRESVADLGDFLRRSLQGLQEDFAFLAECNVGNEFMAEDKLQRLRDLAAVTWTRHFDDRLGLSHMELNRLAGIVSAPLPVVEQLLADKSEHRVARSAEELARPFGDNPHGFCVPVPKDRMHLGELYNLSVRRGTLTAEERFIIQDHIVQTILMLKELPFPAHLKSVPEVAGAHHETMLGTGYPRGLKREQMSIPARILALADVFEALTASDRPYKKSKTLSEALRIMAGMVRDQHLDAEVFRLFLESGVYLDYAEEYLEPDQIDRVDVSGLIAV
ncbi:MAG: GAF domain-containing protein [Magnetococcales bacterium]|nr:GAF domain-containing protein [Magnetococcales bacterium]